MNVHERAICGEAGELLRWSSHCTFTPQTTSAFENISHMFLVKTSGGPGIHCRSAVLSLLGAGVPNALDHLGHALPMCESVVVAAHVVRDAWMDSSRGFCDVVLVGTAFVLGLQMDRRAVASDLPRRRTHQDTKT